MKTGIVLEGGAMRGMFTAGILDVWMEQGISFDTAVGVSAGATFGINLKSHQIGRTLRYNKKYCKDNTANRVNNDKKKIITDRISCNNPRGACAK